MKKPGHPLTAKAARFCEEYVKDLNATQAAIRAGYSERTAYAKGSELLKDPRVQARISELQAAISTELRIDAQTVLKRWWEIATADANELVEYRRVNCRFCWGVNHAYQWTEPEYERACRRLTKGGGDDKVPDATGGFGFNANRDPHPECPECRGDGDGKIHVHDSRKLKGAARTLYRGVQLGKDGLKVLMADQDKALENVARHLGMFKDRLDVRMNPSEMSDAELDAAIAALEGDQA